MDVPNLTPLLERLETNVDDLEIALEPLLRRALSESSAKLPLLDKAKLYVLVTYAIESILFSSLRLNGVNAKDHPVFQELARVKQYFEKIKSVEAAGTKRDNLSLDKQAAGRIIRHALVANNASDRERAKTQTEERAKAYDKANVLAERRKLEESTEASSSSSSSESEGPSSSEMSMSDESSGEEPEPKRQKHTGRLNLGSTEVNDKSKDVRRQLLDVSAGAPEDDLKKNTNQKKRKRKGGPRYTKTDKN